MLAAACSLIDIGINLMHADYDRDRDAVMARAFAAGVGKMIVTGSSGPSTHKAIELARLHPGILFATAGVHPHHAAELDDELASEFTELVRACAVVAIGECGLDYFRDYAPRDLQRKSFHRQLDLAAQVGKPLFLHVREAHDDFVAILHEHPAALEHGGVAHCFTGSVAELEAYLDLGLSIGVTGWICDERRGAHLIPLMRQIPSDRLLLETDGPYLLPRDLQPRPRSRRNEPAYLPHIAAAVARARGDKFATLAANSTAATERLFRLP